ncbi:hypothetical protein EGW08_003422, partial [Elysia chlorotica]
MDACIANSISHRTAYIMKTYGQSLADLKLRPPDYGTFSSFTDARTFTESKSDTATESCKRSKNGRNNQETSPFNCKIPNLMSRPPPMVKSAKESSKPSGSTAKTSVSACATGKARSVACEGGSSSGQRNPGRSSVPPSEGSALRRDGGSNWSHCQVSSQPRLPMYDTFYSPKCYQPVSMFNLGAGQAAMNRTSAAASRETSSTAQSYGGTGSSSCSLGASWSYGSMQRALTSVYEELKSRRKDREAGNMGSRSSLNCLDIDSSGTRSAYSSSLRSQSGTGEIGNSRSKIPGESAERKVNVNANKKKCLPEKSKSAVAPKQRKSSRGHAQSTGTPRAKKSPPGNPDLNNNFNKGVGGICFGTRSNICQQDCDMSGPDRISILAKPKRYPCTHRHYCDAKKITPDMMRRLESLAQPKLSHYTVCSCCLSADCLGECTTKFKTKQKIAQSLSKVDWDRLATPRRIPEHERPLKSVPSAAQMASTNRRIEKLSIPRKVIESGDYYMWLWNKKLDNNAYLKPIKRMSVAKCDLKDLRVLLRCDLDFTKGKPIDDKVRDALPTMQLALKRGVKSIVIISRCGPDGVPRDPAYSLKPLAQVFEQYLETRVIFLDDSIGFQAQALCEDPVPGSVFLLENLSYNPEELGYVMQGEEKIISKPEDIAKYQKIISDHGDLYITDSFAEIVHMTNTSVGHPSKDYGYGFNIKKELSIFYKFAIRPPVPVLAIVAGPFEKTWTVVRNLMGQVSDILVGGHVGAILIKVIRGFEIGSTEFTPKMEKRALKLFSRAKDTQTTLHLPSDFVV